jgi:hypothetical protein
MVTERSPEDVNQAIHYTILQKWFSQHVLVQSKSSQIHRKDFLDL